MIGIGIGCISSTTTGPVPFSDTAASDLSGDSPFGLETQSSFWNLLGEIPRDIDGFDDNRKGLGDEILVAGGGSGSGGGAGLGVLELKSLVMLFCFFKGFDAILTLPNGFDNRSWSSPFVIFIFESHARLLRFQSGGVETVIEGSGRTVAVKQSDEGSTLFPTHPVSQRLSMSQDWYRLR